MAPELAKTAVSVLSQPLFSLETSGVGGTKKHPRPWRFTLHPSVLDVGIGTGAVLAALAFWAWADPAHRGRESTPGESVQCKKCRESAFGDPVACLLCKLGL